MNWHELAAKAAFALVLLTAAASAAQPLPSYAFVVAENGASLELVSLPPVQSNESRLAVFSLPTDADIAVSGALYAANGSSLLVSRSANTTALVAIRSSQLTSKRGAEWTFAASLSPSFSVSNVDLLLPPGAVFANSTPPVVFVIARNDSVQLEWNATDSNFISAGYRLANIAVGTPSPSASTPAPSPSAPQPTPAATPQKDNYLLLAIALVLLIAGMAYIFRNKLVRAPPESGILEKEGKREKQEKTSWEEKGGLSQGQSNLLRALSDNDAKIVQAIRDAGGEVKRFELERQLGMAKSSLALSLRRLEQKNIVTVERSAVFQRIALSGWFKAL
ncbi:hypothetical protein HY995_02475 [Candidatus Micrarchaeota archaeon]|nr:hypothetical protein [Candidatus Micrarchaeota archaeon]